MRLLVLMFVLTSAAGAQTGKSPTQAALRDIPVQDLPAVASRVYRLRATPSTITMRVGQTVELDSIKVTAIDGLGHVIGRLHAFDFGIKPGEPVSVVPRHMIGTRAGTTELTVRYPRSAWGARTAPRPFVTVRVVVKP